ncbi:GlxA family transcriptional regulator [Streptomyces sp. NPDC004752]
MTRRTTTIAVLIFNHAPMFETSVPIGVFGVDRSRHGVPAFEVLAVAAEDGMLASTSSLQLLPPHGLDALDRAGVVIVPTWRDPQQDPSQHVLQAIVQAHADGAVIVGLCMGAFVLAAAGLLDGRRAATHWAHAPALTARYPTIHVDSDALYVDEGDVITSAGTAAGLDACLHLVRRAWGARVASTIARRMVVPPHRSGGQAQYIEQPVPSPDDSADLSAATAYALAHLDQPLDIDTLAALTRQSRRTFDRRFRAQTGSSPLQWLLHQRVLHAQRLLEDTDLTIDAIAARVGFTTGISLRPHFRRLTGITPQQYRNTHRAKDPARTANTDKTLRP